MARKNTIIIDHEAGRVFRRFANGKFVECHGNPVREGGLLQLSFHGSQVLKHRLIYIDFVQGPLAPWMQIDHILGREAGDGIGNLRWTDARGNSSNRRTARKGSKSGLIGASWEKNINKWRASITVQGKMTTLGFYSTAEEAHKVYVEAKRILHETCTI